MRNSKEKEKGTPEERSEIHKVSKKIRESQNHRIIELTGLEETFEIIMSNPFIKSNPKYDELEGIRKKHQV
ncbi:hypothetical protein BTVI_24610 [Pitangus sulphuratus]|nr:hypothetical protein BTVI_24610 [Pitangus sulphuratus]